MRIVKPDYYDKFTCIADQCKHTCCAGWEIDIDESSLARFGSVEGAFGERLRASIERTQDGAFFRMDEGERCPFLNASGLCDMILTLGQDSLCQICADHPRFVNVFSEREEVGYGLTCESAARLILGQETPVHFSGDTPSDEDEEDFFAYRREIIGQAQNRSRPFSERFSFPNIDLTAYRDLLLTLERMDDAWTEKLERFDPEADISQIPVTVVEQLFVYMLWRHLHGVLEGDDMLRFCRINTLFVLKLSSSVPYSFEELLDCARLWSSEIEYSEENIGIILDALDA